MSGSNRPVVSWCGLTMTRTVGRHERKAANRPALSFHSRGRTNTSISLLASSINSRRAISLSRSCPADRPARLRKLNHSLLSRCCRLAGLPNLDSRPLIGNSVRRLEARDSGRSISPDGLGSSRHSVGHPLRILAWRRRRRFKFRNVFHVGPCAVTAEASRRSFEELS